MTKIDIISGFLGAGKTTFIKKLLEDKTFADEKLVLIENEFGEVGIDSIILKNYGIEIKEMNSGCICCTIAGDFSQALKEMLRFYKPDRIIIEPSGVGKLSDVIKACKQFIREKAVELNTIMTVIDVMKYRVYIKNFAEFYKNQLINAKIIILSRTQSMEPELLDFVINDIRNYNPSAPLITTEWNQLTGAEIVKLSERAENYNLESNMLSEIKTSIKINGGSYKIADLKISGSLHKEHHHADEVFTVWGKETAKIFNLAGLQDCLKKLKDCHGFILRAKGIVKTTNNRWIQFDYVPGESSFQEVGADFTGRICVIGESIDNLELSKLFDV